MKIIYCEDCKHVIIDEVGNKKYYDISKCKKVRKNYISQHNYEYCTNVNTEGSCEFFEAKE
jgi:hypothetical protein